MMRQMSLLALGCLLQWVGLASAASLAKMSFEEPLAENGLPAGAFVFRDAEGRYQVNVVDGGRRGGKCLRVQGQGQWCGVSLGGHQPYDANRRYVGAGWLRVSGEGRGLIKLDYFDADHQYLGSTVYARVQNTKDWRRVVVVSDPDAYPKAKFITAAAVLEGNGEVLVDDLSLESRPPVETESRANLLANGGAEYGADPLPWHFFTTADEGSQARFEWSTEHPHSGKSCLRIYGSCAWAVIGHESVDFDRSKTYVVSGWGRVARGRAVLKVDFYAEGKWLGDQVAPTPFTSKEWTRVQFVVDKDRHPTADRVGVAVVLQGDGDVSFDDLMLTAK